MKKFMLIAAAMATMLMAPAAMADDTTTTAAAAAGGAAVGTVVQQLVKVGGNSVDCNAIPIKGLNQTELSNIQSACEALDKTPEKSKSFEVTPNDVKEWGMLAKEFGSAIGSTAKELGVQVNDFLRTPAGVLITVYLFWHKLGGIFVGIPFLIAVWYAFFKMWDRLRRTPAETTVTPVLFGLFSRTVVTKYDYARSDVATAFPIVGGIVMCVFSAIIICTIIL